MRRFTLVTIIVLLLALAAAAFVQLSVAGRGERRYPGPGASP
ncbi:MAG TPA: hypothetical protein VEA19_05990 [Actinomycetota bacterium]|nr:hypothetical protein [Actinomycetota bacterium]